jgi:hypothetical protein
MKKIFFLLLLVNTNCIANKYYINPSGDNTTGLTPAHGWTSIAKLNASWRSIAAGDSILFKKGETFYGAITIGNSGRAMFPIVIGSYGTGSKPVITGLTKAANFKNTRGHIWESSNFGNINKPNMVTISNVATAMGRYPNSGYNYFTEFDNYTFIRDAALSGKNFTGGRLCIRKLHDIISNDPITNHTGSEIRYVNGAGRIYNTRAGYGYFVEDHLSTLDAQNEWFFDVNTKKIYIYSAGAPVNVKVSTVETLVYIGKHSYITIDGIAFEGANKAAIDFGAVGSKASTNIVIKNCSINNSGRNAVFCTNNTNCTIDNCTISNSLNNAIYGENEGGRTLNITITNNTIKQSGTLPGMGYIFGATSDNISYNAITILGDRALIMNNTIEATGHVPVAFFYNDCRVRNNFIRRHNFITDDGGGINVFDISGGKVMETGREICGNIVLDGIGAPDGTPGRATVVAGIYVDDKSDGVRIDSNTIANTATAGIYFHNATRLSAQYNTIYNSVQSGFKVVHDNHAYGMPVRGLTFTDNIIFQLTPTYGTGAKLYYFVELRNGIDGGNLDSMFVKFDNNIYARPFLNNDTSFRTYRYAGRHLNSYQNFAGWKSSYARTPFAVAWDTRSTQIEAKKVRLEYNAGKTVKRIDLGAKYKLPNGSIVSRLTLQPWSSSMLIYYGK